jgi:hypothetical protein
MVLYYIYALNMSIKILCIFYFRQILLYYVKDKSLEIGDDIGKEMNIDFSDKYLCLDVIKN